MRPLRKLLENHALANVTYVLVLVLGLIAYWQLPRAQYPEVNLNWVVVVTALPAASSQDVEHLVTVPLEAAARRVADIRFVASTSRENVSTLMIRFREMPAATFAARVDDLRRELQFASTTTLPRDARPPNVLELTTANVFPSAMIVVTAKAGEEQMARLAREVRDELESLPGVDKVWNTGMRLRELLVEFSPTALKHEGVRPDTLARTLMEQLQDFPAGSARITGTTSHLRVQGSEPNAALLARLPLADQQNQSVPLGQVASLHNALSPPTELVRFEGKPAVLLSVTRQAQANTLDLVAGLKHYIETKTSQAASQGAALTLLDDQTIATREAIGVMERNTLFGFAMVLFITWFFLGTRLALLTSLGVPFALAATFALLYATGQTLNVSVLLGVAIVLGIPLDDAVVVAEATRLRLSQGMERTQAVLEALREVSLPVSASVFATIAAFVPLLFMPGLIGEFMRVVPWVVIIALLASLASSLWILPAHVSIWCHRCEIERPNWRSRLQTAIRHRYTRMLLSSLRHPGLAAAVFITLFAVAGVALSTGWVRVQFFASDPMRIFNVNVEMPPHATLEDTLRTVEEAERRVRGHARAGEIRATLSVAGQMFTETEQYTGDQLGQLTVSLNPAGDNLRSVPAMIESMRKSVEGVTGAHRIAFQMLSADLPQLNVLNLKLQGNDLGSLRAAADDLEAALQRIPAIRDVSDDAHLGKQEVTLKVDHEKAAPLGLTPLQLAGLIRMHWEGLVVASIRDGADQVSVRLRANPLEQQNVEELLKEELKLPDGRRVKLGELFIMQLENSQGQIRHYNHRRTVTIQANLDKSQLDTTAASAEIAALWDEIDARHPGVSLSFTGELDDIQESLHAIGGLFLLGVALMYLLLAVQFPRFWQPPLIMSAIPMAFSGVLLGLFVSGKPLNMYTLYGCIALAGVSVNASIVLVAAANDRRARGMRPVQAAVYAARRRVIPILITFTSIVGGLVALAFGLAGESLLWGPLAASLIWGLAFATPMTLFIVPLLYTLLANRGKPVPAYRPAA